MSYSLDFNDLTTENPMFGYLMGKIFGTRNQRYLKSLRPLLRKINALEPEMQALADEELAPRLAEYRRQAQEEGRSLDELLPEVFALVREASRRILGMRHYDVQLVGGIVLHQGKIAEMKTGEGKTLVATLPVVLNAISGRGVHVVTVNDYLARRDAEWMGQLYKGLGLSVGIIVHGLSDEERKAAYNADITYGTNNEFGFDYLRDNMKFYKEQLVQRGHNFAIVDEVDSILIDEARTPLIISGAGDESTGLYRQMDEVVRRLKPEEHFTVDEKARTALLTEEGVAQCERILSIENLFDPQNIMLQHHIQQSLRAHHAYKRDVDYIVSEEGKVVIVDEFTGRLMEGRRFGDGLHQALEAKERVNIEAENQTLASITFQNYFRMYDKLSGMTGTAQTEAVEFSQIYGLETITIPTNKPMIREDRPDLIYRTQREKFIAIVQAIKELHEKGQPVLVGTISIEKSELLSKLLSRRGVKHEVLNAKHHEKEAEIVAQAGKKGAVTIATNMAGRGTDIMLGGNAEHMAKADLRREGFSEELIVESTGHADTTDPEILKVRARYAELEAAHKKVIAEEAAEVCAAGGLFIIGTERHESRRIDNQLRGRAGRQGDPGASRFFISLEDDLMRLFGGERVSTIMDSLGVEEDMPIENKMISGTIENAQKKLEARNFSIRKNVLQFDDVMNSQREIIYGQRGKVLRGEDVSENVHTMIHESIAANAQLFLAGEVADDWDFDGLRSHYRGWLAKDGDFRYTPEALGELKQEDVVKVLTDRADAICADKEKRYGSPLMREFERVVLLRTVDTKWMEHIDAMEELRKGIYLRSYGQRDPVVEYRIEGFNMFDEMVASIREDTSRMLLTMELRTEQPLQREQVAKPTGESGADDGSVKKQPAKKIAKPGRNDPCPCGSGKKFKKCTCEQYKDLRS